MEQQYVVTFFGLGCDFRHVAMCGPVVPTGLWDLFYDSYPALKRWAKLFSSLPGLEFLGLLRRVRTHPEFLAPQTTRARLVACL